MGSNNKQTSTLSTHNNSFDKANRVRCFNHILQLSAKTFLKPFNPGLGAAASEEVDKSGEGNNTEEFSAVQEDEEEEEEDGGIADDKDHDIDEMDSVEDKECGTLLADTVSVRETVTKVCCCLRSSRPLLN
jgi:hypothetical protein